MPLHNDKPNADRLDKLARPEVRAKLRATLARPEVRAKLRATLARPEVRAKLRAAQKAAWTRRPRASSSTVFSSTGKRLSPS